MVETSTDVATDATLQESVHEHWWRTGDLTEIHGPGQVVVHGLWGRREPTERARGAEILRGWLLDTHVFIPGTLFVSLSEWEPVVPEVRYPAGTGEWLLGNFWHRTLVDKTAGEDLVLAHDDDPFAQSSEPRTLLRHLRSITELPLGQLAELLAVTRRTVYHWLEGEPMSPENRERLFRVHTLLTPVAERLRPGQIREWLNEGAPSPRELLRGGEWVRLDERVREALEQAEARLTTTRLFGPTDTLPQLEIEPLDEQRQRAALAAFRQRREPRAAPARPVLEYLDSSPVDE